MKSKTIIRSKSDILKFFHDAAVPKKELLIGLEVERSGIFDADLIPIRGASMSSHFNFKFLLRYY